MRIAWAAILLRSATILFVSLVSLVPSAIAFGEIAGDDVQQTTAAGKDCSCEGVWPNPCGPACLGFALKHFGVDVPPNELADDGSSAHGVTGIDQIQAACRKAGLHAERVQLDVPSLERVLKSQPAARVIVAFKNGHFGYVEAIRDGQVCFIALSGKSNWCPADKVATAWAGETLVISKAPLSEGLDKTANVNTVDSSAMPATITSPAFAVSSNRNRPLMVILFYCSTCGESKKALNAVAASERTYGNKIAVIRNDIDTAASFNQLLEYEIHYNVRESAPPKVFLGTRCLAGSKQIAELLNQTIQQELASGATTFNPTEAPNSNATNRIYESFQDLGVGAVLVAGLIDGVNPCAFTTLIFLLSMLAYLRKTRLQILTVGVCFTAAVFVTYVLLGLGCMGIVKKLSSNHGIASGLTLGTGLLALTLSGWSFLDAFRYKTTGEVKAMSLGLPKSIKTRIHKIIREGLSTRCLAVGSLSVGFLVSVLESLCTGQVYLPTIMFITREPEMRIHAIGYLLLYNLMFIMPLIVVFGAVYMGVKSDYLGNLLRQRLTMTKCAMGIVFAGLGILVLSTL
jgi:hypothetical protein